MTTMSTKELQQALLDRGYFLGTSGPNKDGVDGDAGSLTIEATSAFQKSIGLPGSGIPGPLTYEALRKPVGEAVAPPAADIMPPWLRLAYADVGIVEGVGKSNNPKVLAMFADAGFPGIKDDETAWCAAAVGAWLKRAGFQPSGSLAARSYEKWGVGLLTPRLGCIATKRRGGSSWQGHVGLVVGANASDIILLGANQNNRVSIASFKRNQKGAEFTSYRWPTGYPLPTETKLPTTVAGAQTNVREA